MVSAVMHSTRITLVDIPEFCVELEYTAKFAILHIARVTGFNRTVLKKMRQYADQLQHMLSIHYGAVYTAVPPDRDDLVRLAPHMGYERIPGGDGYLTVYRRKD